MTVEDRGPGTQDETQAETADDTAAAVNAEDDATSDDAAETAEAAEDNGSSEDAAETAEAVAPTKKKKKSGRWVAALLALMATLFVGSAAFAGATVQPYLVERANIEVKLQVARAAANAITTLWSYTPDNMDRLADRAATYLSGDFGAQYRKFVDQIAAPNRQAKVTNSTEVTGVAVESLDPPNAVAIVYTNTTTTSPLTKNIPTLKYLSYRLVMKRDDDRWKVTRMTTVTSLDVTPQF